MAKTGRKKTDQSTSTSKADTQFKMPFLVDKQAVDPSLALLFASSAGPVRQPPKARYDEAPIPTQEVFVSREFNTGIDQNINILDNFDEELSSPDGDEDNASIASADVDAIHIFSKTNILPNNLLTSQSVISQDSRKRKVPVVEDDLEGKYMLRIVKEEEREEEARQVGRRTKRHKLDTKQILSKPKVEDRIHDDESDSLLKDILPKVTLSYGDKVDIPKHETLTQDKDEIELEKSSRTVFLANVSTLAIMDKKSKKILLDHMGSFLESLPVQDGKSKHKIESIRFRSTAYAGTSLPKKAAFARKNLMETTTKSTNAYLVYSTAFAAREAVKRLNGTTVLDRHLRVDGVAHPTKIDHRRCIFVGNLGFVDDESLVDQGGENERKRSKLPSDVEEGLWRQFSRAGIVESVRVVRDERTRVGKGFAYVQFQDANSVEVALLFDGKKYPPMLPRVLRVTRAKAVKKTALAAQHASKSGHSTFRDVDHRKHERIYNPKLSAEQKSLQGRAAKLLGKAGAARFKSIKNLGNQNNPPNKQISGIAKSPENIVFEGHRASSRSGRPGDLMLGGSRGVKRKTKSRARSTKRTSEWKKRGEEKLNRN